MQALDVLWETHRLKTPVASPRARDRNDHASNREVSGPAHACKRPVGCALGCTDRGRSNAILAEQAEVLNALRFKLSNSVKTVEKRTQEFEEAKARVLECMNTSVSNLLERVRGEKRTLQEEARRLKQRLADAGLPRAGE